MGKMYMYMEKINNNYNLGYKATHHIQASSRIDACPQTNESQLADRETIAISANISQNGNELQKNISFFLLAFIIHDD